MENLNNKLAGLRDTVIKIKKEIRSFEENETKNTQNRTNTITNQLFRPLSNYKKAPLNKLNKKLMKNYFKLSLKEQNICCDKNSFQNIMTPQQFSKVNINTNAGGVKIIRSYQNSKKRLYNKPSVNNESKVMPNDNSLYRKKYMVMTDINNQKKSTYDNEEENNSCMNKNLGKYMTTLNKEFIRQQKNMIKNKNENKNELFEKTIMTFSNDEIKRSIFENQYFKNKIKNKENKKLLHNAYNNNINTNDNEYNFLNMNNSAYFNIKKSNKENRDTNRNLYDLFDIDNFDIEEQYQCHSNRNIINKKPFKFNNSKINMKKNIIQNINIDKNIRKNNSYIGRLVSIPNISQINNQINNNSKKTNKKHTLNYYKNDYHCDSCRHYLINNDENYIKKNNLNHFQKDFTLMKEYFNSNKKPKKNIPMNNTINYISNKSDFDLCFKNKEKNNYNDKMRKIIGNNSIGEIYIKAKLFEKCGQKKFDEYVNNNYDDTNNVINNLKEYKNFLIQIKEEDNFYKRQINMYQRLCKENLQLMNAKQIDKIINEIQDNFIDNIETDSYIIEQIKSILPYKY